MSSNNHMTTGIQSDHLNQTQDFSHPERSNQKWLNLSHDLKHPMRHFWNVIYMTHSNQHIVSNLSHELYIQSEANDLSHDLQEPFKRL